MSAQNTVTAPNPVILRVLRSLDEMQELSKAWEDLLANYPLATTFSTLEWLISWWQSFAQDRELQVLALFDSQSRLTGVAPLSVSRESAGRFFSLRVVRLMGDGSGDSDNLDLPVRSGFEREFAESIFGYLKEERRTWDICQLNTMPSWSPMVAMIRAQCRSHGHAAFEYERECSSIALPGSWEEYAQQLSSEDRNNLERYTRRLQKRYAVRIYRCAREEQLPACLDALFRLHQLRWEGAGEPGSFASHQRREFYKLLSSRLLVRGQLEFWVMELDGAIVAAQFAFRFGDQVYQLQEGYNPERATDRVGFILRGEVLRQLMSEGVRIYDFLGGTDAYKARWGATAGHYTDIHFARRFSRGGAWLQAANSLKRARGWLRTHLPSRAWNLLHQVNLLSKGSNGRGV
jgi:CelD/BcsL family acetyltransferase involved in cellulose biosynthesis